jgi:flavodoxin
MKSLVIYSSQTGNTKKLAEAVYETLKGEKDIYPVADAPDPDGYDLVAVGFWLQGGKPDPKAAEYLPKTGSGKRLFLFATHGAAAGSDHAENAINYAKNLAPDADVAGTFSCQGAVNPKVLEKVKAKPQPPAWIVDAPDAASHPDDKDIENLKRVVNNL